MSSATTPDVLAPAEPVLRVPVSLLAFLSLACYAGGAAVGLLGGITTRVGGVLPAANVPSAASILLHNVGVLSWLALGLVTAGAVSAATMVFNGVLLGWLAGTLWSTGSGGQVLTGIAPHLLPELAAYVISSSATAAVGIEVAAGLRRRHPMRAAALSAWLRWQALAVGLLAVAALIETTVSHV